MVSIAGRRMVVRVEPVRGGGLVWTAWPGITGETPMLGRTNWPNDWAAGQDVVINNKIIILNYQDILKTLINSCNGDLIPFTW